MTQAALHPSERAATRARRRAASARLWWLAARQAAPIVLVTGLAGGALIAVSSRADNRPATTRPAQSMTAKMAEVPALLASPAAGTTGTAALPPEPAGLSTVAGDDGVVAARPFSLHGASRLDKARALECLTAAIYYEAASESDDGQRAVAQVVLNRTRHPVFPATVCGVVYQGAERASGCQFSYACDGAMARVPSRSGWARAARIAAEALNGRVFAPVGLATHYHTYAVTPAWNRTLVMTDAIGAHFFHRWKGYWGTAAAFRQRYAGGEPMPGPPAKAMASAPLPAMPLPAPALAAVAPAPVAVTPAAQVQPAHRDSGTATALPGESQVLERWKDSGRPLR